MRRKRGEGRRRAGGTTPKHELTPSLVYLSSLFLPIHFLPTPNEPRPASTQLRVPTSSADCYASSSFCNLEHCPTVFRECCYVFTREFIARLYDIPSLLPGAEQRFLGENPSKHPSIRHKASQPPPSGTVARHLGSTRGWGYTSRRIGELNGFTLNASKRLSITSLRFQLRYEGSNRNRMEQNGSVTGSTSNQRKQLRQPYPCPCRRDSKHSSE